MASSSTLAKSQYHHFIPRFILHNFAHPYKPPKRATKRGKHRWKDGCRPGDAMLHAINLAEASAEVIETPVSRTFGLTDMYRDFTNAVNQQYLEEQLSRLEARVGRIISTIRKTFEAGASEVWIGRPDRDVLRKFLFIMKYRSSSFHKRFYHDSAEGYNADDREALLKYMREKGFKKPIDVWFHNIKAMLELKMDPKLEWMQKLRDSAYPGDAEWFIINTEMMYLAFCTPSSHDDEFLLTENAYSVFEGPVSVEIDPDTYKTAETSYTEFHRFAVITPKLTMVLRSFLLPILEEDSDVEVRRWRETMMRMNAMQHNNPLTANSILEDLPVTKARNSYTQLVDGRIELLDGEDGSRRSHHKFCFRFFPVSTEHVNKINCVMLEQSCHISTIVFNSGVGARNALEYYLGMPCESSKPHCFKICFDVDNDPRLVCLKKLEQAATLLGSNTKAVYQVQKPRMTEEDRHERLGQMLADCLPKEPTGTMRLYMNLGGSAMMVPKDLDQSARMLKLRIKIDVWTQGLDENFRENVRVNLRELFCQLPARRVWYYLKRIRCMLLGDRAAGLQLALDDMADGPEDVLVNASHLFSTHDLCRLMHSATLNHIDLVRNPDFDLAAEITLDGNGYQRLRRIKSLAFESSGSICDCGITAIEEKAKHYRGMARLAPAGYKNPFWTEEENVEMAVRVLMKRNFSDLLRTSLSAPDLQALERVLFSIVYPSCGYKFQRDMSFTTTMPPG
ncbi:hypothetical protein PV04_02199 [Phialophora macrospora]|uniref:DUF4238 domain-containing protein n=1 Tax=Phialophora macrospora TaxID=1851006 RepID=A0A0D2FTN2_9EURO|nr:hypothetical protein PV04_02199 [Phialophora macrospora]